MKAKTCKESLSISSKIVLPNDTNTLNNLMGGQLLSWMDISAGISAQKHAKKLVVTASVNSVSFNKSIKLGDVVTIEAKVSRSFNTSMEIYMDVFVENHEHEEKIKTHEAIYTFVAVDQNGLPARVPEVIPETELEKERYDKALIRKELSLILAGKLLPENAVKLKNFLYGV